MPETRKFEGSSSDPIQAAVRAALGEPVRPNQPGAAPEAAKPKPRPSVAPLGTFTFTSVPKPTASTDEDED